MGFQWPVPIQFGSRGSSWGLQVLHTKLGGYGVASLCPRVGCNDSIMKVLSDFLALVFLETL